MLRYIYIYILLSLKPHSKLWLKTPGHVAGGEYPTYDLVFYIPSFLSRTLRAKTLDLDPKPLNPKLWQAQASLQPQTAHCFHASPEL